MRLFYAKHLCKSIKTFQVQCFEMVFVIFSTKPACKIAKNWIHSFTLFVIFFFWNDWLFKGKTWFVCSIHLPVNRIKLKCLMYMRILNPYFYSYVYIIHGIQGCMYRVLYDIIYENEMMLFLDMFQSLSFTFLAFFDFFFIDLFYDLINVIFQWLRNFYIRDNFNFYLLRDNFNVH